MKKHLIQIVLSMGLIIGSSTMVNAQWVNTNLPSGIGGKSLAVSGNTIFCGGYHGIFLSVADGSWTANAVGIDGLLNGINVIMVSDNTIFAVGEGGINGHPYIYRSTDNGTTWTEADTGTTGGTAYSLAISGTTLIAGTTGIVSLSTNNGKSWVSTSSGLPASKKVLSVAIIGSTFLAGMNGGGIYRSTTNGDSWSIVTLTQYPPICAFAQSGSRIYAGTTGGGVVVSTDDGTSWTGFNTGLTNLMVTSLIIKDGTIYAGTLGGVFVSTNGTSWASIGLTDPAMIISSLAVKDNYVYAGTWGYTLMATGVYRRPLSEIVSVLPEPKRKMANQVALSVHFSSLAKSEMTIGFAIPCSDRVTVAIYNVAGHKISTLVNTKFETGAHNIVWNTKKVASGCYTIRLQVGSDSYAKSIKIIRN